MACNSLGSTDYCTLYLVRYAPAPYSNLLVRIRERALAHDPTDGAFGFCGKEMESATLEPARPAFVYGALDECEGETAPLVRAMPPTILGASDVWQSAQVRPLRSRSRPSRVRKCGRIWVANTNCHPSAKPPGTSKHWFSRGAHSSEPACEPGSECDVVCAGRGVGVPHTWKFSRLKLVRDAFH